MGDDAEESGVLDDDFYADPHGAYRRWRAQGSVHRTRDHEGVATWVVLGYEASRAALADPRLRKDAAGSAQLHDQYTGKTVAHRGALTTNMLHADPPDHTRLRTLVNKAFTARAVQRLRDRITEITDALLEDMAAHDEVDLLEAFAVPLPITVICELLGVPVADRPDFQGWTNTLMSVGATRERATAAAAMRDYLTALVQSTRAEPGDDLLSALVRARDDQDRLSERELISTAFLLLVAGFETTVNLIGTGVHALLSNPDQLEALRADPSLVRPAIEEFLRYDGPINHATTRYTGEPVTIDDTEIPAGEFVAIALTAANRDPARFTDPDRLDITREPTGHLAFGHGIHFCVGASLARLEAEIAFTRLLARFPRLTFAEPDAPEQWRRSVRIRGLTNLRVRLDTE